ncbi:putative protein phosphatase 2C 33 [Acorus gramineus]|uniref:protein-serine/threonine phosphatase n=1 Tax=Acorus gramineus TaxID=55184 RepID=A0AAV9A433_ACOGR|nr:putative protein phosphatase 2C 33 [Acorus gramineus]
MNPEKSWSWLAEFFKGNPRPRLEHGFWEESRKGEDHHLIRTDCLRVPGDPSSAFSVFAIFDGHNGSGAAIFTKERLLDHVLDSIPPGLRREQWLVALRQALSDGFVKTDNEFQRRGARSGTTVTFVVVDCWTATVASVRDSRCILEAHDGMVSVLTVDDRLEENSEDSKNFIVLCDFGCNSSVFIFLQRGPLRCWPGGLCISRSIGDTDVGDFIVPDPHVKQVKLSNNGGRLIIASDGVWDALASEMAAKCCQGLPAPEAAKEVVKQAVELKGLRDDTTCIVVDIIPPDHSTLFPSVPKKKNVLKSLISWKMWRKSPNKLEKKLSSLSTVEVTI